MYACIIKKITVLIQKRGLFDAALLYEKIKEEINMLKTFNEKTKFCNYLCAALTLCLLVLQFTPFWHFGSDSLSINGYVWLDPGNASIASWFSSQLGYDPNTNSIVISAVLILLLGAAGIAACIIKSNIGAAAVLPALSALSAIYAFVFKPVFRLGSTWILQLALSIAIIAVAVMAVMFELKKNDFETAGKDTLSKDDIDARVAAIKSLTNADSDKTSQKETNFNKLLTYLSDELPECRIAAAEALGTTSKDSAFTYISHILSSEKDERVIRAMRQALVDIRENMQKEHKAVQ